MAHAHDLDPTETQEWLAALDAVLEREGPERTRFLLEQLLNKSHQAGIHAPYSANTPYLNTIPLHQEEYTPGDPAMEWRIRSLIRWNAMAMVVQANKESSEYGGHIATFASYATLYDVGFNHFWHAPSESHGGDLVFFQGHSAPGVYARAFLEGRLTEAHLKRFRREIGGGGLSSYPHPWLMPDFWQFPTVSMGLGPMMGIFQARFMKYLQDRGILNTENRKVWVLMGDGEVDEPESLGSISLAARENLDNLIFVINCNLQRLDGPVRGNSKIIQEMEAVFRGSGWNVIKVIWGSYWDPLIAEDKDGLLLKRMEECVDGEYQTFKARGGAYTREHFFGKYPELKARVSHLSDEDIWRLNRGGHDPHKVYAAYAAAMKHKGQPTLILAKTVKGYGMGESGEGQNMTHSQKKMGHSALRDFRNRFQLPLTDEQVDKAVLYRPTEDSPEIQYMKARRAALGGYLPQRRTHVQSLPTPELAAFDSLLADSGDRTMSTTMAFVRLISLLARDKHIGKHIVPIVPDEARTFGMEGLFRQLGIYSSKGQLYEPVDADQLLFYREDKKGQILEEGINEAGAISSWIAAGTAYSHHGIPMIPFYIFYSMFGFQRVGDLIWAAADSQVRGFLIGGTSGRTTLAGEGLQHQDGHSQVQAAFVPNCVTYDPTFAYELAVIIQDGLRRMVTEQENIFYYITAMNESYHHPAMPDGAAEGILKGMYLFKAHETDPQIPPFEKGQIPSTPPFEKGGQGGFPTVQLLGCGSILREVIAAAELLRDDFGVAADIWSAPGINVMRKEAQEIARWNMLHPTHSPRISYIEQCVTSRPGPVIAATDYLRLYADQLRPFIPRRYTVLGTDGFGRSDGRVKLREFFEVNRYYVVVAALWTLAQEGAIASERVDEAIQKYGINPEKPNPVTV